MAPVLALGSAGSAPVFSFRLLRHASTAALAMLSFVTKTIAPDTWSGGGVGSSVGSGVGSGVGLGVGSGVGSGLGAGVGFGMGFVVVTRGVGFGADLTSYAMDAFGIGVTRVNVAPIAAPAS